MKLGDRLKELRSQKNLTQDQLAEQLFVSRQTVSKWELGVNEPDVETLQKLAQIFGVPVAELFEMDEHTARPATPLHKRLFVANVLIYAFCALSVFVLWRFLPEKIPAHYNAHGEIDRYGYSSEVLLHLASFAEFFAVEAIAYFACRNKNPKAANAVSVTTIVIAAAYWIFVFVLHGLNIRDLQNILSLTICICQLAVLTVSAAMHPKISRPNALLGVRTGLTLTNKEAWNRVNRFAAYALGAASAILLTLNMVLPAMLTIELSALGYLPALAATAIYHRVVATKFATKENVD